MAILLALTSQPSLVQRKEKAMESKFFLSLILLSSWVFLGFSQDLNNVGGLGGDIDSSCITKLLPCQLFLKDPSSPPATCCLPLKEMIKDDPKCLCGIFFNKELLKNFNMTQEDALKLPKGCAITVDVNMCNKAGPSAPSPASATSNGTDHGNSTDTSSKKNSADGLSPFTGLGFIATFVALLSAF